jgi:hypothetical protein
MKRAHRHDPIPDSSVIGPGSGGRFSPISGIADAVRAEVLHRLWKLTRLICFKRGGKP